MALTPVNGDLAQQYLNKTLGLPIQPLSTGALPAGALAMGGPMGGPMSMAGATPSVSDALPNMSPAEPSASIAPKPTLSSEPNMSVQPTPSRGASGSWGDTAPKAAAPSPPPFDFNSSFSKITQGESGGAGGAQNKDTGAVGVFQLMPKQAQAMGYSPDDIKKMSPEEQRDVLFPKYLASHKLQPSDIQSDQDMALSIAAPGFVKSSVAPDTVIYGKGSDEAKANPSWRDPSGNVTVASLDKYYGVDPATKTAVGRTGNSNFINAPVVTPGKHEEVRTLEEGVDTSDLQNAATARGEAQKGQIGAAFDPEIAAAQAEQAKAEEIQRRREAAADQAQKEKLAAKDLYDQSVAKVNQAQDDYQKDKAPAPFGGNVISQVLATIGQAMGAYGASITHTRNFASDMINEYLGAEQKRWEQNHLTLKYKVDSLDKLSDKQLAEFNLTKSEHQLAMDKWNNSELQAAAARKGTAMAQKNLGLMLKDSDDHVAADLERLQMVAKDHVKVSVSESTPTERAPTMDETTDRTHSFVAAGGGLANAERARGQAGLPPRIPLNKDQIAQAEKFQPEIEKLSGAEADLREGLAILDKGKKSPHGVPGVGPRESFLPDWAYGVAGAVPGVGNVGKDEQGVSYVDQAKANRKILERAATVAVVEQVGKGHVGIERAPQLIGKMQQSNPTEQDYRAHFDSQLKKIEARKRAFLAGIDDEAVRRNIEEGLPQYGDDAGPAVEEKVPAK